jgi:predicted aspartyl protease
MVGCDSGRDPLSFEPSAVNRNLPILSLLALLGLTAPVGASPDRQPAAAHLIELLSDKHYLQLAVELKKRRSDHSLEVRFVEGVFANTRNAIPQSIAYLKPLLSAAVSNLTMEEQTLAFRTLADDYAKTFRYADAEDTLSALLLRLGSALSPAVRGDIESDRSTLELLRDAPAQTVYVAGTFDLATKRDAIGAVEAPVVVNGHTGSWILDTGANMSLLIRSRAEALGLTLSRGTTPVTIFGGKTVPCHMSVIPRLRIGNAEVRNVAVLIMEDKDYYIPQIHFQFQAFLGYPVLSALARV